MKKIIALLFFAQFISLSQTAQVKQTSDACPGSNKKNKTSNDYAYLSKRSAAKDNSDFNKPKYQSIYAKKTVANTETKRGKSSATIEKTVSAKADKGAIARPEEKNTPTYVAEEKNTSSKSNREPEFESSNLPAGKADPAGEKAEEQKAIKIKETEITEAKEAKHAEINKTETEESPESTVKKGKSTISKKDKESLETTKDKTKQQKKTFSKKMKLEKNSATDCPQF